MKLRVEVVLLCVMFEFRQRRKSPRRIRDHNSLRSRLCGKWNGDRKGLWVRCESASVQPDGSILHHRPLLVDDHKQVTGRSSLLDEMPLAFADERAARSSAADKLDHPCTAAVFQLGKREIAANSPKRRIVVCVCRLGISDESIERKVGIDLALVR